MFNNIIASESFTHFKTTYFFDYMQARNERKYIAITCSKKMDDGKYNRSSVQIFEDDFEFMLSALSSLFHHAQHASAFQPSDKEANGIKSWEPESRPREKMLEQGRQAMSDAELLAMLIGSGYPGVTAVDLAGQILLSLDHDLNRLADLSTEELTVFQGIGLAKAMSIQSAMELAVRVAAAKPVLRRLKAVNG
ncbi:UPF0758 domain-containing protein [Mucilaginibacter paludis]|uniref:UPF0758 domain-containing protein n=1 Tax=Mucilaginibacter paludis DSM 18603 TaxID=714943 RepID=H1Y146_9SPHI|nr:UPF0758 domain-containing protein [Mucilaginibacter paludis]EHQ29681.1 hypothetical protein Mucpa_5612 [Mucilaginibacter paludis DSM 18603]